MATQSRFFKIMQEHQEADVNRYTSGGYRPKSNERRLENVYDRMVGEEIPSNVIMQERIMEHPDYGLQRVELPAPEPKKSRREMRIQDQGGEKPFIRRKIAEHNFEENERANVAPLTEKDVVDPTLRERGERKRGFRAGALTQDENLPPLQKSSGKLMSQQTGTSSRLQRFVSERFDDPGVEFDVQMNQSLYNDFYQANPRIENRKKLQQEFRENYQERKRQQKV